jgi:hypothetical protein
MTRTDRLFEIYETASDAVRSFSGFLPNAMREHPQWGTTASPQPGSSQRALEPQLPGEAAPAQGEIAA